MPKLLPSRILLCVLAISLLAFAGCGGDDGGGGGGDEGDVKSAIKDYAAALKDKDYDDVCDRVSSTFKKQLSKVPGGGGDCPEVLEKVAQNQDIGDVPDDPKVNSVKVDGNKATAKIEGAPADAKFVKEDGDWKLDLGTPSAGG